MAEETEPSVARILAHIMMDGMPPGTTNEERTVRLNEVGFSNAAIAEILKISKGSVSQNLYSAKAKATKGKKK